MARFLPLLALAGALLWGPAGAQEAGTVLTGKQAMGGWRDDAPGVTRRLTIDDLEAPFVTTSAANSSAAAPMQPGQLPTVAQGYRIELIARDIDNPRAIRFSPNGDLFIANSGDGQVLVLKGGQAGRPQVFIDGLDRPYGVAFYPAQAPKWIYIAESGGLKRYPYAAGDLKASGPGEPIITGIAPGGHWTRDVVFSADGKTLYYSVGSGSNVGDGTMEATPGDGLEAWIAGHPPGVAWGREERRAAVLATDPEGGNERYFATGLRNCAGMTLQPMTGRVWCVVNERDALGDNIPFDYATALKDGAFYGWPWFYNGEHPDPRWAQTPRDDLKGQVTVADVLFQAHSAPLNIAFETGDGLGAEAKGDAFVALHGSWNRGTRTGYKIVELDMDASGQATGAYTDFVTGFVLSDSEVWGRPVGVAFDRAGNLYFSEDGNGTIWKVSRK
ncbi:MAG TPA: PQQ-dependent sugar dehydrogenase [Devosia sp.]|nr:PQQ-dependent sugar dehydrogenase [Devosia sp.]